jgi:LPS-assembly protein
MTTTATRSAPSAASRSTMTAIRLVAQRVTYDRDTSRWLIAFGGVEIVDRDGNASSPTRSTSPTISATASSGASGGDGRRHLFRRRKRGAARWRGHHLPAGRLHCLRTLRGAARQTADLAHRLAAGSSGTAARAPCASKAPASNFFGLPIAYLPFFEIPDPTVRQKTGFLSPSSATQSDLGIGFAIPYYFALSPTFDLTVQGTYYTRRASWARPNGASVSIPAATICASPASAAAPEPSARGANNVNASVRQRGMVSSTKGISTSTRAGPSAGT